MGEKTAWRLHPLTGFSGTIDSKQVLPLAITALDLLDQRHTNAAVLDCLLCEENKVLELGGQKSKLSALTIEMLLEAVTQNEMRVILDVGAQIIECSNGELAKAMARQRPPQRYRCRYSLQQRLRAVSTRPR